MRSTGSVSFTRNPLAPARIARATYSSSSNVVTITTLHGAQRGVGGDLLGRPQSVAVRHPDVEERDIDRGLADRAQQLLAAGCLDDDLDVGLRVEQRAEAGADELVIVGERDPDHDAPSQGRRAVTIGAAALRAE